MSWLTASMHRYLIITTVFRQWYRSYGMSKNMMFLRWHWMERWKCEGSTLTAIVRAIEVIERSWKQERIRRCTAAGQAEFCLYVSPKGAISTLVLPSWKRCSTVWNWTYQELTSYIDGCLCRNCMHILVVCNVIIWAQLLQSICTLCNAMQLMFIFCFFIPP